MITAINSQMKDNVSFKGKNNLLPMDIRKQLRVAYALMQDKEPKQLDCAGGISIVDISTSSSIPTVAIGLSKDIYMQVYVNDGKIIGPTKPFYKPMFLIFNKMQTALEGLTTGSDL